MTPPEDVVARISALPIGTTCGQAAGRAYVTTRSVFNAGRSCKIVAEERGGRDYISLNFYDLGRGPQLSPCEMSSAKVIAFLRAYEVEAPHG